MQTHVQREVMAVTLTLFVRMLKAHTSARVKQALKGMVNTVKVIILGNYGEAMTPLIRLLTH